MRSGTRQSGTSWTIGFFAFICLVLLAFAVTRVIGDSRAPIPVPGEGLISSLKSSPAYVKLSCSAESGNLFPKALSCKKAYIISFKESEEAWYVLGPNNNYSADFEGTYKGGVPDDLRFNIWGAIFDLSAVGEVFYAKQSVGELRTTPFADLPLPEKPAPKREISPPSTKVVRALNSSTAKIVFSCDLDKEILPSAFACKEPYSIQYEGPDKGWNISGPNMNYGGEERTFTYIGGDPESGLINVWGAKMNVDHEGSVIFKDKLVGKLIAR